MSNKEIKKETTPAQVEAPKLTDAEKIWNDIKNARIEMFGLPNQVVSQYCTPVNIEPSKLYILHKVGAVLPALEEAFANKYSVELYEKYITISPKK